MYTGQIVFSQLMDFVPMHEFRRCVNCYDGNRDVKSFSCLDQLLCMMFAQLSYRESLRDIESCLRAMQNKLYHMGMRGAVKSQIWIAVSAYVLVAIVKKRLRLNDVSLYTILQILSVTLFEKTLLLQLVTLQDYNISNDYYDTQLKLFDY